MGLLTITTVLVLSSGFLQNINNNAFLDILSFYRNSLTSFMNLALKIFFIDLGFLFYSFFDHTHQKLSTWYSLLY